MSKLISKKLNLAVVAFSIATSALLASKATFAHERFILPSHTQLSGDKAQSVSLIASISNDIYHPDRPLGDSNTGADVGELKALFNLLQHTIIAPDGKLTHDTRWQAFARFSAADVKLTDSGTYRIALVQPDIHMTTFTKADGNPGRVFGKQAKIPNNVKNVVKRTTASRVETFVSMNSPTHTVLKPTGQGLELSGDSHPNDLFAGEPAQFQLVFNGKPLTQPAKVKLIKGGTRHRNERDERLLEVDGKGQFNFTAKNAGFYFLTAEVTVKVPQPAKVDVKHYGLYVTLEVFPE